MSSTNKTTNYNLSQFIGSDKPAWLVDYNGDMSAIDTQMKANADAASAAQSTANTADSKADTNASAISTLDSQINGTSGVAADVVSLQGSVNTINSLIGNGTPTTTDKTLIGAINELDANKASTSDVNTLEGKLGEYQIEEIDGTVTGTAFDGTVTVGDSLKAALDNLVSFIKADAQYLKRLIITDIVIDGVAAFKCYKYPVIICNPNAGSDLNGLTASQLTIGATSLDSFGLSVSSGNYNAVDYCQVTSGNTTITDKTSDTPASGNVTVHYQLFSKLS